MRLWEKEIEKLKMKKCKEVEDELVDLNLRNEDLIKDFEIISFSKLSLAWSWTE